MNLNHKKMMFTAYALAVLFGIVGMSMLFHLAGWKWSVCVGSLSAAFYFRGAAFFLMFKAMEDDEYEVVEAYPVQSKAP